MGCVASLLLVIPSPALPAPLISNVSGTVVSGSGFGSAPERLIWETFENGTDGQPLTDLGWGSDYSPVISSSRPRGSESKTAYNVL